MSDLNTLRDSLARKQAEVEALEKELRAAQESQFTDLPAKLGLASVDEVIRALAAYASPRVQRALGKLFGGRAVIAPRKTATKAAGPAKTEKRKRAKITPELKEQIVQALQAGGKTAGEVAVEFSVSVPTVNNIKRDAGLTKTKG